MTRTLQRQKLATLRWDKTVWYEGRATTEVLRGKWLSLLKGNICTKRGRNVAIEFLGTVGSGSTGFSEVSKSMCMGSAKIESTGTTSRSLHLDLGNTTKGCSRGHMWSGYEWKQLTSNMHSRLQECRLIGRRMRNPPVLWRTGDVSNDSNNGNMGF